MVMDLLQKQFAKHHCLQFDSLAELLAHLAVDSVVLSQLALISKLKSDGSTKHRLICIQTIKLCTITHVECGSNISHDMT